MIRVASVGGAAEAFKFKFGARSMVTLHAQRASRWMCAAAFDPPSRPPPRESSERSEDEDTGFSGAQPIAPWVRTVVSGVDLLRNPKYNKGMAFDDEERERMHLQGLLPPGRWSQRVQVERVLHVLENMTDPLSQYTFMMGLQERNERLFYRVLIENLEALMPIIYSPTVSKACKLSGLIFRKPRGLFLSIKDSGRILQVLKNWPEKRVKLIAASDGSDVLGLGDMGIQGMGNLVGKLALYTCGGVHPSDCLPVTFDFGTDNDVLLNDKFYLGNRHRRVDGETYDAFMDEFMEAVRRRFGSRVLVQFENMSEGNAKNLVDRYRGKFCLFNDDTEGIAAAVLAGVMAATTKDTSNIGGNGGPLHKHTYLIAGESGINAAVPEMLTSAIARETKQMHNEARSRVWLFSGKGLVVRSREETLQDKCLPYAHNFERCDTLVESIHKLKPSVLIGAADKPISFTKEVVEAMARHNTHPILISASNVAVGPHEVASCHDVMRWSEGRAIFIPAKPGTEFSGERDTQLQHRGVSTAFISPGIAMGALLSGLTSLREELFFAAAETVASCVTDEDRRCGSYYPGLDSCRRVAASVAAGVMMKSYEMHWATNTPRPYDLDAEVASYVYQPFYRRYR